MHDLKCYVSLIKGIKTQHITIYVLNNNRPNPKINEINRSCKKERCSNKKHTRMLSNFDSLFSSLIA